MHWWFQLILTSFGWHVIPAGHFPQKSLSKNPRIGFSPLPTVRPCPFDPWPTTSYIGWVQAGGAWISRVLDLLYLLLMHLPWSGDWSCTLCRALLASYDVGCFSICHSLWLASFGDWASLDHGPTVYFPPSDSVYSLGLFTLFAGSCVPFSSWVSLAHLISLGFLGPFPILLSLAQLLYTSSLGLMGLPLAIYFLCLYYFGPAVAYFRFSTYCPWVCFLSLSGLIQARLLL